MKRIMAAHGSGGRLMEELIAGTIAKILGPHSIQLDDSAVLGPMNGKIAFTTDSYTVTPLFFPGGDIGTLAINGTVNDLAVMGALPKYLSCSLIIEEGLPMTVLERVLHSMKAAATEAEVEIVTGDTKVVGPGSVDKLFINTSGLGIFQSRVMRQEIKPGDRIISSGTLGDHGITIMSLRQGLEFSSDLKSDCRPLTRLTLALGEKFPKGIKFMRDATRGGAASVLNEIVTAGNFSAVIEEDKIPLRDATAGICRLLGLDPLYVANEGKLMVICEESSANEILETMKSFKEGEDAQVMGHIEAENPGKVLMKTAIGARRIVPLLSQEQLPRIC